VYNKGVHTKRALMPATTTRTRKSTARKVPSKVRPAKSVTETTETKPMTETKTRPNRPTPTLISWKDYQKDIKSRIELHNYEVNELLRDLNAGLKFASPYVNKGVEVVKDTYQQVSARVGAATTTN